MAKKKKKRKGRGLGYIPKPVGYMLALRTSPDIDNRKLLYTILSIGGGAGLSHLMGNNIYASILSIGATIGGLVTKNLYLTAGGASMLITAAPSAKNQFTTPPADEINGFNLSNLKDGAKARVGAFFNTFKDKFKLPDSAPKTAVNGLDNVYTNPMLASESMNQLNNLERQLDQMNGTDGFDDIPEREL